MDPTGRYYAVIPITNPPTQLTMQAADAVRNIDVTHLNVQLSLDIDSDGIANDVDGDCTTTGPTSNSFSPSDRFCDIPRGGKTSGQVIAKDTNIILTISDVTTAVGGLVINAVGPMTQKATVLLDGLGNQQPIDIFGGSPPFTITAP